MHFTVRRLLHSKFVKIIWSMTLRPLTPPK